MNHMKKTQRMLAALLILVLLVTAMPVAFAESFSAYVKSSSMAVYSDASLTDKIGTLSKYTVFTVKSTSGGVARISLNGNTGYAKMSAMEAVEDVAEEVQINAATRVYQEPDTGSASLKVKKGMRVNRVAVNGSWALIENDGVGAYIKTKYLSAIKADPTATPKPEVKAKAVIASDTKVYAKASTSSNSSKVKAGMKVDVLDTSGSWSYVRNADGICAYIQTKYLVAPEDYNTPTPKPEVKAKAVIASDTKVYAKASTSSNSSKVKAGMKVDVLDTSGSWSYVRNADGICAYIQTKYLVAPEDYKTPAPTPTATPKPSPTPDMSDAIPGKVTDSSVKVYAKASTSSTKLGTVKKGTVMNVVKIEGSWALVELDGNFGYCKVSALSPVETDPTPTPTPTPSPTPEVIKAVIATDTKVYAKASTSSNSSKVKAGTKVDVLNTSGSWAYVRNADGICAYIQTKYLVSPEDFQTPTPSPSPSPTPDMSDAIPAKVTASSVKVYAKASTSSTKLGTVKKGTVMNVVKIEGSWALVELDGNFGYCKVSALSPVEADPTPTPTPSPSPTPEVIEAVIATDTKVYAKASTSSNSSKVKAGTKVDVLNTSGDWAYVRNEDGICAYIQTKYLVSPEDFQTPTPEPSATPDMSHAIPAKVSASSVAVYAKASASSTKLGTVKKGTEMNVVKIEGSWALVELNGNFGYCKVSALTPVEPEVTPSPTPASKGKAVIVTDTKVYAKASASSNSTSVKRGTKVDLLDTSGDWAYIRNADDIYAYIPTKYLVSPEDFQNYKIIKLDKPAEARTTAKLDAYSEPDAYSAHLGTVSKDTTVTVSACTEDGVWAKVSVKGVEGWVKSSGLEMVKKDPLEGYTKESFTATVVTQSAKIYDEPEASGGTKLAFGTNVEVSAYNSKWAYAKADGKVGFIPVSDLSRDSYSTLSKGSSGSAVGTLEKALLAGGYFDGQPDNTYDTATVNAVKRFQSACGVTADGEAGAGTQRMLYSGNAPADGILSNTLSKGSKGDSVTRVQTRLLALGYLSKSSSVDGDYGNTTTSAIMLFQASNGISDTGTADAATLRKLYSTSAATLPSGKKPADQGGTIVQPESGNQKNNSTSISDTLASKTSTYSASMSNAEKLEYVIYVAQNQLGKPYVYGANGTSSYDCTGLTCYCFKQIGISLPRTAVNQGYSDTYRKITSISDLKRGDLVYLDTVADSDLSDHAGIYLGAGWYIHASSGQKKVVISSLTSGYYNRVFSWGRRVFD